METRADSFRQLALSAGWSAKAPPSSGDRSLDLLIARGKLKYAVQVKAVTEGRREQLEGALAAAILRARVGAKEHRAAPLAVVWTTQLSDRLIAYLLAFVERYGDKTPWGAIDAQGRAVFFAPGLEALERTRQPRLKEPVVVAQQDPFSDLGQWLLKVLLSHKLPAALRVLTADSGAIARPIKNSAELARIANVSPATVSRLLSAFRELGFVRDVGFLELVRTRELLQRWRLAGVKRPRELRTKWLLPPRDPDAHLVQALSRVTRDSKRACIGYYAACARLGYPLVSGVAPHVYVEPLAAESLRTLGLRKAEAGEKADVFLLQTRFAESLFRGARRTNDPAVTDVIQCWLDVADHAARGAEMASYLEAKVLAPFIFNGE